ncbi:uncharacterized protein VTP21DRAFT_1923 [Calcarisporiella thermophila]|uniref:uncharacterized protein n=1 Tax=Calcarisporiella thermophila TaxID=911321 RepID=UPI003742539A
MIRYGAISYEHADTARLLRKGSLLEGAIPPDIIEHENSFSQGARPPCKFSGKTARQAPAPWSRRLSAYLGWAPIRIPARISQGRGATAVSCMEWGVVILRTDTGRGTKDYPHGIRATFNEKRINLGRGMAPKVIDYRVSTVVVLCKDCGQDVGLYPARHKCASVERPPLPPLPTTLPAGLDATEKKQGASEGTSLWSKWVPTGWGDLGQAQNKSEQKQGTFWDKLMAATEYVMPQAKNDWPESDDSDWEGETHISRILREHHEKKSDTLPRWLQDGRQPSRTKAREEAAEEERNPPNKSSLFKDIYSSAPQEAPAAPRIAAPKWWEKEGERNDSASNLGVLREKERRSREDRREERPTGNSRQSRGNSKEVMDAFAKLEGKPMENYGRREEEERSHRSRGKERREHERVRSEDQRRRVEERRRELEARKYNEKFGRSRGEEMREEERRREAERRRRDGERRLEEERRRREMGRAQDAVAHRGAAGRELPEKYRPLPSRGIALPTGARRPSNQSASEYPPRSRENYSDRSYERQLRSNPRYAQRSLAT